MGYLVFARKYRPQTFAEILGQEAIVTTLTNAIRQKRIAHAYLFAGPRGTGKTSTARIFAKALNCKEGPTPAPCLKCERCQEITRGSFLDVLEIDGASNRGIDQIRALRELAKFTPASGAFKVYIIDEVHQITAEGFNALLKTLEEPPPHVLFILATTAPHKVPATILSRCQRYDFKRLPMEVINAKIKAIAAEEKLEISEEAVVGIARVAQGSLRDAESILDQAAAFAGGKIGSEDLRALLGMVDEETFAEAVSGIQAHDPVRLLRMVAQMTNEGTDLTQWALDFLGFLRNLLVVKVGAAPLGLEGVGPEAIARLAALAESFSVEDLTAIAQILERAVETMRRAGEPRIPLEMALVRLSKAPSMASVSQLLAQLEAMEERLGQVSDTGPEKSVPGTPPARSSNPGGEPGTTHPAPSSASSAAASTSTASAITLERVRGIWPALLNELHQKKASAAAYLSEASPIGVQGEDPPQLVVGFRKAFEFHRQALDRPQMRGFVEEILSGLLGAKVRCLFKAVENLPEPPPAASSPSTISASSASSPAASAEKPPQQPDPKPDSKLQSKPDSAVVNSVLELFEGRLLPGEG